MSILDSVLDNIEALDDIDDLKYAKEEVLSGVEHIDRKIAELEEEAARTLYVDGFVVNFDNSGRRHTNLAIPVKIDGFTYTGCLFLPFYDLTTSKESLESAIRQATGKENVSINQTGDAYFPRKNPKVKLLSLDS